jgi:hypothetical protein
MIRIMVKQAGMLYVKDGNEERKLRRTVL